ncbi:hypothetical protein BDD12DRAFT_900167 [Trichophaea hybrida]|nr:hypothetical protein BDD12DRAFT_900167 [Trichophaea hybrida]
MGGGSRRKRPKESPETDRRLGKARRGRSERAKGLVEAMAANLEFELKGGSRAAVGRQAAASASIHAPIISTFHLLSHPSSLHSISTKRSSINPLQQQSTHPSSLHPVSPKRFSINLRTRLYILSLSTHSTISSNSIPLSTQASQSSSRSRAADQGNGSSTSRQLRSSTRGNDTGPAADSHPTPPSTQDTSHLSQAAQRETAENIHATLDHLNQNPIPPNIDINTVLRALTAALESHRGPGSTNITSTIAASSTSTAAELPGNDPMLLSIQDMFPAIDTAVVQSIFTNKFRAENLLKLEASFTYKKKRPQFYSFGAGDSSLNIATTSEDVELEEYESISHLMRPFTVYMAIIVTFPPPPQKLPLAFALISYQHTLYDLLRTHRWDSLRKFHVVFHQKRICLGVYEPVGWSTQDHGLETAQLFKRNATNRRK